MIKVVRGNPTPEELAATLAVVRARAVLSAGLTGSTPKAAEAWADPARLALTTVPAPGPRSWGRTYWPS